MAIRIICTETDVDGHGDTLRDAVSDFRSHFSDVLLSLVNTPESDMMPDAIALRDRMLKMHTCGECSE